MKKVYKALDFDGHCLGIVAASSRRIAQAYFTGRDMIPHSLYEVDIGNDAGLEGLLVILKMRESKLPNGKTVLVEDFS